MDETAFRRILTTFADTPADVNLQRGEVLVQVRDELLGGKMARREDGHLYVTDSGVEYTARRWLVERVAKLPMLADRVLSYVDEEPFFVTPRAGVTDELERAAVESVEVSDDAVTSLRTMVSRTDRVGTAAVVYLLSDAGEGKTTVINTLARRQAALFKAKQSPWLVVPISLGGRPFLRFDDVVAAALLNKFRFPLFFESFIELVRLGVVVPALDGFEEMFVESAVGDAVSALGNLMGLLQSSGAVVVAARQAYYDYKNLDFQARLYDSLGGQSVSFSCVRLKRWEAPQFIEYASKRDVESPSALYSKLSSHLPVDHPLLTRAVLATRIIDLARTGSDADSVIDQIDAGAADYFGELVRPILSREAMKWVDKSGEPYHPLLTVEEHMDLLQAVAREMWLAETAVVPAEILEWASELFCSARRKGAAVARQVLERIKHHALLVNRGGSTRGAYQFDHEEFFHYFLGKAVASLLLASDDPATKAVTGRTSLPEMAVEIAAVTLHGDGAHVRNALESACRLCRTEPSTSFVRENLGAVVMRALHDVDSGAATIEGLVFPRNAMRDRRLRNLKIVRCEFAETDIDVNAFVDTTVEDCRFDVMFVHSDSSFVNSCLINCEVRAIAAPGTQLPTYDPIQVQAVLRRLSALPEEQDGPAQPVIQFEWEESLKQIGKMVRKFLRSTEINENTMRQAFGAAANGFFKDVLPELLRRGIVRETEYQGAGSQKRFRLGRPLHHVSGALNESGGSFERFLDLASR